MAGPRAGAGDPITDQQNEYANQIAAELEEVGVRAKAMLESDRMQAKIRQAQGMKVPYMLIVGEREANEGTVSLRKRDGARQNDLSSGAFLAMVQDKIVSRDGTL